MGPGSDFLVLNEAAKAIEHMERKKNNSKEDQRKINSSYFNERS